jgi:L-alanine-DL-glutamate epimerase-like enolase superfamily enzyme
MKIITVEHFEINLHLAVPYTIAYETVSTTTNIILKITASNGLTGWGCAAPDKEVTGETPQDVVDNIEKVLLGLLIDQHPFQIAYFTNQIKLLCPKASSTLAMTDMALHDLLGRTAKIPLYQLLGGFRSKISTSITIGILPIDETLETALKYKKDGFNIIKLKGGLNMGEDIDKIMTLRDKLGKSFVLRFDANQGYTAAEAIEFIDRTRPADLEILEQPTCQTKDHRLGEVTQNTHIPVMADESIKTLADAFHLARHDRIDMVNIKLMKMGGILESQHINSVSKAAGLEVMVGCIDECALGISAGLHFALSRRNIEYADLDGHLDLKEDPFVNLFKLEHGVLYPSDEPGLGKITL